jgi:hypothetical protein
MSQQQLDAQGEAHEALGTAVASYGQRVLNDPHILGNLVTDLLPDLPRERSLLVTGAEAGVAAEITRHVQEEHVDPDTAVQLAARMLSEHRAIDPAASMWVASEYAQALGYRVRPYAVAVQSEQPQPTPAAPPTMTALSEPPMPTMPPPTPPVSPQVPPIPYAASMPPPQGPSPQSWPPQGSPTPSWPPTQPPFSGPPPANRRKRGPVIAAIAVAGAVVLYLAIAAVAQSFPFAKSHPAALPKPSHTPSHRPSASPSPTPTLATLKQLLPPDIDDPNSQCSADNAPPFNAPGLTQGLDCTDPGLPGGTVNAVQMNSFANYQKAWASFNSWWGFDGSTAGSTCPPAGGSKQAEGTTTWNDKFFPYRPGQVLECEWVGTNSNAPAYVWTFPTENAIIVASGAANSTFSALDSWWTHNGESFSSPTPSAS